MERHTTYKVKVIGALFDAPRSAIGQVWEFRCHDHCPPAIGERMIVGESNFETGRNNQYVGEVIRHVTVGPGFYQEQGIADI